MNSFPMVGWLEPPVVAIFFFYVKYIEYYVLEIKNLHYIEFHLEFNLIFFNILNFEIFLLLLDFRLEY